MNKIGRTIFYDKETGEVIFDSLEREGFVFYKEPDFYISRRIELINLKRDTFDYIELEYGQYCSEFNKCTGYKVNTIDKSIIFEYTPQVEEEIQKEKTLEEKVTLLETENAELKLALAETVEKQERDKTELQLVIAQMVEVSGGIVNG